MRPFLRDRPTQEMTGQIDALTAAIERADGSDPEQRSRQLGLRGDLLRIVGRTDEALRDVEEALGLTRVEGTRVRHLIRLGTVHFYGGRYESAQPALRAALAAAQALGDDRLTSFAHQHLGKCLAEADQVEEARAAFQTALEIRERLDLGELVASSRRALEALDERTEDG